jgi:hypothetical protein
LTAIDPAAEDIASPGEYETGSGTRALSAKSGSVLWPKKPKTQKTNTAVRENLSRSFDFFTACLLGWTAFPTIPHVRLSLAAQQHRQLGDVRRNPPRVVAREQFGLRAAEEPRSCITKISRR